MFYHFNNESIEVSEIAQNPESVSICTYLYDSQTDLWYIVGSVFNGSRVWWEPIKTSAVPKDFKLKLLLIK